MSEPTVVSGESAPPRPPQGLDWRVLYEEFGERVFRLLHRMLGEASQAEDLTQDTFVRVHQARHRYDGRGSVDAWIFRIAGNLGRDELRRRAMQRSREPLLAAEAGSRSVSDPHLRMTLESALERLGPEHRLVVLLHDVDGYDHATIAEMLGIAVGSSRARLSRAREELRLTLAAEDRSR